MWGVRGSVCVCGGGEGVGAGGLVGGGGNLDRLEGLLWDQKFSE